MAKKASKKVSVKILAYESFKSKKPVAKGKTVTEVIKKAKAKGVSDPYIVKGLPKGITAFF